ncbi:MAG TPA: alpha/beta fold hydrolase [Acidimicrobiia bacterium]|nr:alpha/beta fold hydrolase [Acidimicrobiia bacterium]
MPYFDTFDGSSLYYDDQGDGRPLVLLHGFAADTNLNFVRTGIFDALLDAGYRVIALDSRGHGLSAKPTDPAAYANDAMRLDVQALLDHLALDECIAVGYSMGGHTALRLAPHEPRLTALALLGIGETIGQIDGGPHTRDYLVKLLETDDPETIEHSSLREFRLMAGLDREPLVAFMKAPWVDTRARLDEVSVPVVIIVGEKDQNAVDPSNLAAQLNATLERVPGDHFTANARPELHQALLEFLAKQ